MHYGPVGGLLAAHVEADYSSRGCDVPALGWEESLGVDAVLVVDCFGEILLIGRA